MSRRPLDGVRVLEPATMIAGPFCASILAEFGAEVIKVEVPGRGDPFRTFGTMTRAGSTMNWLNEGRNKKSITLDLRRREGAGIFKRLAAVSDLIVENFRPGTLEAWGIGEDVLKTINPRLVLVRISAYGQDGPYAQRPGYARVAHGYAGLAYLAGEPDGPPVVPGSTSLADYVSGLYGALGALLALRGRDRWGEGQTVDMALYEGILRMLDEIAPVHAKSGFVRERMGADTVNVVPHSHYRTEDGKWVALACSSDRMFARLADAMERPDLVEPDRFATMAQRIAARDAVNRIVADWIGGLTRDELMRRCLPKGVPIGPINSIADIFEDAHIRERGNFVAMHHPAEGEVVVPDVIPRLSATPGELRSLGPELGEHTDEVLGGLLGLSDDEIATLKATGVV